MGNKESKVDQHLSIIMTKGNVSPRKELVYSTKQALVKNVVCIALHLLFNFSELTGIDL